MQEGNWLPKLEPIVRRAGDILLNFFGKQLTCTDKKSDSGFVTEADIASEQYLIEQLKELLPETAILAEESGAQGVGDYSWVIDPLDGTTNFAIGVPLFSISVALSFNGEVVCGVIYAPLSDELFFAQRGMGAWLNGHRISVSDANHFDQTVIGLSLPYRHDEKVALVEATQEIVRQAYATRRLGSAALDLAYVACGRFDGALFSRLFWWDVAAGIILIQEAGGVITDFQGKTLTPSYQSCVAGNAYVHAKLQKLLKK